MRSARAPVVVAVGHDDGGDGAGADGAARGPAGDAACWAGAEAATRGCPLRVVHAGPAVRIGGGPPDARRVLDDAVARVRAVASDLEISTELRPGPADRALLAAAADARLLVVGIRHGARGFAGRSVPAQLAAQAPCPVVVVGPVPDPGPPGRWPPRVVVGADAHDGADGGVAGFALRAARQRGVPLFVVRAWTPDLPADLEGVCGQAALAEQLARHALEPTLRRRRAEFPDVVVHTALVRGDPARALIARSHRAALLVLGTGGHAGAVLGPVGRAVLRHGPCPVAVVPSSPEPAAAGPRRGRAAGPDRRDPRDDRRRPA